MFNLFGKKQSTVSTTKTPTLDKQVSQDDLRSQRIEKSRRLVSSVVVSEEIINPTNANDYVRYVEVPTVEEVEVNIPKVSVVNVQKRVPVYEIEYQDKIVEVPQIVYVDNPVEVPVVQNKVREVVVKQVKEIPKEVIKKVPKIEYKTIEKIVRVPGERIEVPKVYNVEKTNIVKQYKDTEVPVVVAKTMQPLVSVSNKTVSVPVVRYEPEIVHVDIRVPKPVKTSLIQAGVSEHVPRQTVQVPAAQYNSLLKLLNKNLSAEDQQQLPYMVENGSIPFLKDDEAIPAVILSGQNGLRDFKYLKNSKIGNSGFLSQATSCWKNPFSMSQIGQCAPTHKLSPFCGQSYNTPKTENTKSAEHNLTNLPSARKNNSSVHRTFFGC
ncbi:uncharacterized protein LOC128883497 [Hylaeus volcanicus]|uniref:uncharacterized protein LOC128883497 n=1 Tax=Hylaeus volcanicus TaxID=313075 RepID=UPI0023B7C8B1|nr:uncharacterized protein LOC128883497 [Hylaeus volcanicus]